MKKSGVPREDISWRQTVAQLYEQKDSVDKASRDWIQIYRSAADSSACRKLQGRIPADGTTYKEGKVKAIGLSNFNAEQIQEILSICEIKPSILQTEVHPYSQEKELKAFLKKEGIAIQAWYPLGHGDKALIEEPLFAELGKKYGKSSAQIILRWHIQEGTVVIPGSKNPEHIRDNFDLFDFSLTREEMEQIAGGLQPRFRKTGGAVWHRAADGGRRGDPELVAASGGTDR
ncbi:MAG: aldo/keto reductase [Eisenbergiella sp.]